LLRRGHGGANRSIAQAQDLQPGLISANNYGNLQAAHKVPPEIARSKAIDQELQKSDSKLGKNKRQKCPLMAGGVYGIARKPRHLYGDRLTQSPAPKVPQ